MIRPSYTFIARMVKEYGRSHSPVMPFIEPWYLFAQLREISRKASEGSREKSFHAKLFLFIFFFSGDLHFLRCEAPYNQPYWDLQFIQLDLFGMW